MGGKSSKKQFCRECQREINVNSSIKCSGCNYHFDHGCLRDIPSDEDADIWKCPYCIVLNFSREVHVLRSFYQGENQTWIKDRLTDLIIRIADETSNMQDVEVTICIDDEVHVIGENRANKITVVLKEDDTKNDGIKVSWTFKTMDVRFTETAISALYGTRKAIKGMWKGIVNIFIGTKDAIAGTDMKAITN